MNRRALLGGLAVSLASAGDFDYQSTPVSAKTSGRVQVHDITFASLAGRPTPAYMVVPAVVRGPAILFVHWYESPSVDSNRTQFLPEAIELASDGIVSLLPATMWSDPNWFQTRKREDDLPNSLQQTRELRRALDVLLAQKGVDPKRVAYVGHDFGAMFGAVLADVDRRACCYALQAGTNSFSDWYLFGPKMTDPERKAFIEKLSVLDPIRHIAAAPPTPLLFQFGTKDEYVPEERAKALFEAAKEPKKLIWYEAGHGLNLQARLDRVAWLRDCLR